MSAHRKCLFFFLSLLALPVFFSPKIVFALNNGNFESGGLSPWESGGLVGVSVVTEEAHGESYAVKLESNSSNTSGKIWQLVTGIEGGRNYRFSGYGKITDSNVAKMLLRIAWYQSSDGSGSQKSTNDSNQIEAVSDWEELSIETLAPEDAVSAKVRAIISSKTDGILAFGYFDDLIFEEIDQPTPTPTFTSISYPSGVVLSEFMPDPGDGNEWAEIKNTSSDEVVLSDWQIDDIANIGGSPKNFSVTLTSGSYFKVDLGNSFLNNPGDEVRLLYPDGSLCDKTSYSYSNKAVSWIKNEAIWCEAQDPTPEEDNSSCREESTSSPAVTDTPVPTSTVAPTVTLKPTKKPSPTPKLTPTNKETGAVATEEAGFSSLPEEKTDEGKGETLGESTERKKDFLAFALIGGGLVLIAVALSFLRGEASLSSVREFWYTVFKWGRKS